MNIQPPTSPGAIIALIALVVAVVFLALGTLPPVTAYFIIVLAAARLL